MSPDSFVSYKSQNQTLLRLQCVWVSLVSFRSKLPHFPNVRKDYWFAGGINASRNERTKSDTAPTNYHRALAIMQLMEGV